METERRPELLDQPRCQTMFLGTFPVAVEAAPEARTIRLVLLVDDPPPGAASTPSTEAAVPCRDQIRVARRRGDRLAWFMLKRAARIVLDVEKELSGLNLVQGWFRRLIQKTRGLDFGEPLYESSKGVVHATLVVEPRANYDDVHRELMRILEKRPDYEPRCGRGRALPREVEDEIERMPAESPRDVPLTWMVPPRDPSEAAQEVLREFFRRRRAKSESGRDPSDG